MSELLDMQVRFARLVPRLIDWAFENGYEVTGDQWERSTTAAAENASSGAGIIDSLHTLKLAIDLNLFRDRILLESVEGYKPIGEYWKTLDLLARWGGDFSKPDADHFSLEYQGVR